MISLTLNEVDDLRCGTEFRLQAHGVVSYDLLGYESPLVIEIAEKSRPPDACRYAHGQLTMLEPVDTEGALTCVTDRTFGDDTLAAVPVSAILKRRFLLVFSTCLQRQAAIPSGSCITGPVLPEVERPCLVRACGDAVTASDTDVIVNHNHAIGALPGCFDRAYRNAWRIIALHTRARQKLAADIWISADLQVNHRAGRPPPEGACFP